jgi:hypothetical protein
LRDARPSKDEEKEEEKEESKDGAAAEDEDSGLFSSEEDKKFIETMRKSNQAKRDFFDGIQFQMRNDSIQLKVMSQKRAIFRNGHLQPNFHVLI